MTDKTDEAVALLPCPFCDGEAHKVSPHNGKPDYVTCLSCSSGGPYRTGRDNVAAWNGRPSLASRDARIAELEALLEEAVKALELVADSPSVPVAYQWSGDDGLEGMFDPELRHKNGSKAPDYLKAWLSMFRPFAVASRSDSWGELEKLICIVMRNYVRMAAKNAQARATLYRSRRA